MNRSGFTTLLSRLAFAALLFASASIREGSNSILDQAIIWLPTGIGIAGLCLLGVRAAWVIALATMLVRWSIGYDWTVGVTAAAGSTLEALIGVAVLRRFGFDHRLGRLRDMGAVFVAAMLAPLGSILFSWLGRAYVWSDPNMPFYSGWGGWWRMNVLGAVTVVPVAVAWLGTPRAAAEKRWLAATLVALVGIPALVLALLAVLPSGAAGVMWLNLVLLAVVIFATEGFGMRGVTLATVSAAIVVALATARGFGPFAGLPHAQLHVSVQLFELTLVAIPPTFVALMTERRDAIERGRQSEERLASINRNVKDGLFRADPQLRLLYANGALARLFGRDDADAMSGWPLGDAMADPVRRAELLALVREQGQWTNEELEFRREDGSTFWGLVSGTGVRDAAGAITHYDGAITDITAHKALEERLRDAQKMEAVGKLAGGVAHDFNNLLTVIIGHAENIRGEAQGGLALHADAGAVLDAATRAAGLTRQLLAYSRRQMLSPRVVELGEVVDRMGEMLRRLIGEDVGLAIEHRSGPCWVRVDPSQLEQVLLNLVVNARDALRGGGEIAVSTAVETVDDDTATVHPDRPAGPCAMLRVRDTGVGMSPEVRARAFDPFFTTKEVGGGTGLGLATVYGIVRQSGGAVWLESAPGSGTTATICLPLWQAPATADDAPVAATRSPRGGTVLVVEDEPAVRQLVCQTLASRGLRVLSAADGAHGLEAASAHDGAIDLVITDVVMPVMGGREMVRRLRSVRPGQAVLFMSGYPRDADASVAATSPDELLAKPFTPDQLLERVDAML